MIIGRSVPTLGCLLLLALVISSSCSSSKDEVSSALAEGCAINSDCSSPLVCAFRRCHNACETSRDCPTGERCVASDRPFYVCQLSTERNCSYNSQCPQGQVCGVDGQCRDQCASGRDCVPGQVCISGTCADQPELTPQGQLPVAMPDASDETVGITGRTCLYTSECTSPLVCRSGLCLYECLADVDCPSGRACTDHRCAIADASVAPGVDAGGGDAAGRDASGGACVRKTCASQGATCGIVADGCGTVLDCGSCPQGQTCGGGGTPNACGTGSCTPASCASLGKNCGVVNDGCSFLLSCGTCRAPATCGGGGVANVCGCNVDAVALCAGKDCGDVSNGCGGITHCGDCRAPLTCAGAGVANVCGCTKTTCALLGKTCGTIPDGCGGTLDCGTCASGTCGGGGTANVCGAGACTAKTCTAGNDCGVISDGCSGVLTCGSCTAPATCGGSGTPNVCGCPKTTCLAQKKDCGVIPDGCGGTLTCGSCAEPATCGGAGLSNVCGCTATTCAALGKNCGTVPNGCGGTLGCGACATPSSCGGGGVPNVCGVSSGAPSCKGGTQTCGNINESCCTSPLVPGGSFNRSNDPTYPATVSDFRLDKYEVSVSRFRAFVEAGQGTQVNPPAAWSGAAPSVPMSGWNAAWNASLVADTATLKTAVSGGGRTWTDLPMSTDNLPIVQATWYEAFAFCAWDQGWLPTEAEWNYAAAGGSEQRVLVWTTDPQAVSDCVHANDACPTALLPVGSKSPIGDGKWGQSDLIGNAVERVMDTWEGTYPLTSCVDCVYTGPGPQGVLRGGGAADFYGVHWTTLTRHDDAYTKTGRDGRIGFRCARAP